MICDYGDREIVEPRAFSLRFARLAKRAGVRVRLNDPWGSYAILALTSCVNPNTNSVSNSLGWTQRDLDDRQHLSPHVIDL